MPQIYRNWNARGHCAGSSGVFLSNSFKSNDPATSRPLPAAAAHHSNIGHQAFDFVIAREVGQAYFPQKSVDDHLGSRSRAKLTDIRDGEAHNRDFVTYKGDAASKADRLERKALRKVDHLDLAVDPSRLEQHLNVEAATYQTLWDKNKLRAAGPARESQSKQILHVLSMGVKSAASFTNLDEASRHIFDPERKGHYYVTIADPVGGNAHATAAINGWGENTDGAYLFDPDNGLFAPDTRDDIHQMFKDQFQGWPDNAEITVWQVELMPDD